VVSLGRVDRQWPEQLAGRDVDDADVEVLDEQCDVGSGVVAADPDAVQLAVDVRVTLPAVPTTLIRTRDIRLSSLLDDDDDGGDDEPGFRHARASSELFLCPETCHSDVLRLDTSERATQPLVSLGFRRHFSDPIWRS
jgi:hypothetical protein